MPQLPQNTAYRRMFYLAQTSLSPAITISKNGGTFQNPAAGVSNAIELSGGWYYFDLQAADTDTLGELAYLFGSGTMSATFADQVIASAPGGDVTLAAAQPNYAPARAGDAMTLTSAYDAAKTAAAPGAAMTLTSAYDAAKTAAAPGDQMTLTLGAMQAFFLTNTGKLYAQAVAGSVVHETAVGSSGGGGDPLANAVPGMYAPGTAGFVIGNMLDASMKSVIFWIQQTRAR